MLRQPKYSKEEHARRGDELYDREIRPAIETDHLGEFVAIDVDSGAYEVDKNELTACNRLLARQPDAQIWLKRVGTDYVRRFGPRLVSRPL